VARAAVFRTRAVPLAPAGQVGPLRAAAGRDIDQLTERLRKALGLADGVVPAWRQGLQALLGPAARGAWPSESRLLYDLQKVCLDQERPACAVDLVEWFVSWGRRPVKRPLPYHGPVRTVKHLRSALHRLTAVRIPEPIRRQLVTLLIAAVHDAEERLRQRLRPLLGQALHEVGLQPRNVAEGVARDKVVEELIDLVIERGFLGMGDLRDAIARNRLKLPDLSATGQTVCEDGATADPRPRGLGWLKAAATAVVAFFLGDQLLRLNRRLAADLDGVYHRGEIYLRWLQRFSAAAFGTHLGRLLTLYVVLPFGGSYMLLKVWEEVLELLHKMSGGAIGQAPVPLESDFDFDDSGPEMPAPVAEAPAHPAGHHVNLYAFVLLGLFFFALLHVPAFRRGVAWALRKLWAGLRGLFYDLPARLLRLPWVIALLQSTPFQVFYRFILKPFLWAAAFALAVWLARGGPFASLCTGAAVFVLAALLLNSRLGMHLEEAWTDRLVRTWRLVRGDIVPGLIRLTLFLFRRLQEDVERVIYTVDEWLRFRPGDSYLSLFVKPVLGLMWFAFTYGFRLIFNLFIEPTFNPIKHFPVVTVTAKLMAPFWLQVPQMVQYLEPVMGKLIAGMVVPTALFLLPGLAGFLVWEFKENWRLYRANQSPVLTPEVVGHHGETVLRLMRPGLHSGTLPKLYARLRHTKGSVALRGTRRQYEALHHLRDRLRQFAERDLLAVLPGSKAWSDAVPLRVGAIQVGSNRIRLELSSRAEGVRSVYIDLEEHGGYLLAGLTLPSLDCAADAVPGVTPSWGETWLTRLGPEQALAFRDALAGFYKLAGVDLVRQQVETLLPVGAAWDLTSEGLILWPPGSDGEAVYHLNEGPQLSPHPQGEAAAADLPVLRADDLLFGAVAIRWPDWVRTWQADHAGRGHSPLVPPQVRLLPDPV
jgi:hypothetical protein